MISTRIEDYDPAWAVDFERESAALRDALAPWLLDGQIEHIGSTAIPGLGAKPIIDMMAAVRDFDESAAAIPVLLERGYVMTPHRPQTHHFDKPSADAVWGSSHLLHLLEPTHPMWAERMAFRDALRASPALVADYDQLKRRLAAEFAHDRMGYTSAKRGFVVGVLEDAGVKAHDWRSGVNR